MNYLKSEHLKFKRTIANKLIFIIPFLTAIFAWLIGGFYGFQYMTLYWWYAFLLPGAIAILCALSHRKEENAGKYYSIYSMHVNLSVLISVSSVISPATAVYSVPQSIAGSIAIILASVWQIPLCLYLARKAGLFVPIIVNTILGIFIPILLGNTAVWWLVPYCYAAKLAEPLMGIELRGTFAGNTGFSITILISLALSIFLFFVLSFVDAKDFSKRR